MIWLKHLVWKIKSYRCRQGVEFTTNMEPKIIYYNLIPFGWQINYNSVHYHDEILNLRKLYGERQIHFRLFKDGAVTLHDEWNPEYYMDKHINKEDFKRANKEDRQQLKEILCGFDLE